MKSFRNLFLIALLFCSQALFSQARLSISSLTGFPTSGVDSVYIFNSYDSIVVTIQNTGNLTFQGEADVMIMSLQGIPDTLFTDSISGTVLAPGDSVVKRPPPYQFTPVNFVDGDNIVVVWPQARTGGVSSDTLAFHIFYISFQGITGPDRLPLEISPNPATDYIRVGLEHISQLEYVRILNLQGQLIYESLSGNSLIPVKGLANGTYFIEVKSRNGFYMARLLIQR